MSNVDKITTSVMSCQIALNQLEAIKYTAYYKQSLKNKINAIIPELIKSEQDNYDKFFEVNSESTDHVYKVFELFIKRISEVPIYDMENICYMIDAYDKDAKSMNGITNKILR
jgi:uncharacterized damage-inducible protein DinB